MSEFILDWGIAILVTMTISYIGMAVYVLWKDGKLKR